MITEFDKYWERHQSTLINKEVARQIWDAAQRALFRSIKNPPFIPIAGDKIKFFGLCHPSVVGKEKEVINATRQTIQVYHVDTKSVTENGEVYYTSGIISEVEKVE